MDNNDKTRSIRGMSDEEIIELYWARNERAIEETSKKYGKYLYTIAYNILRNRLDCEECVNDTYLGTWNKIPPNRPTRFQGFVSKITRDLAVDRYRKNSAEKQIPSEMTVALEELDQCLSDGPSLEEELVLRELVRILNDYVQTLPPRNEFEFVCRYYYADEIKNIADMLQLSRNTVTRDLNDMRQKLKELLEKEGIAL